MRIAMFTNNYKPYIGGVPISIEHLAEGLRKRGHLVWVFAPNYKEQEEEEFVIRYPSFPISVAKAPVPDVVWHGSNGFLYKEIPKREEENADAWAEQIVRILENPGWYQQMSQAARETAEKYSQDAVAKRAEEYYKQICYGVSQWPKVYGKMSSDMIPARMGIHVL